LPELSAVVDPLTPPLIVTVAPLPAAAGLIVPEILKVGMLALKAICPTLVPLTVTGWLEGLTWTPLLLTLSV